MQIKKLEQKNIQGIKFVAEENGQIAGRAYLYLIKNDLHKEPFGFMEDVFVEESERSKGIGGKLVEAVIEEAKRQGCYKIVATSRLVRPEVHKFYARFGFKEWGKEFRMDF